MTVSYKIYVDWNNDGDFSDANEDITTDVQSIDIERGKNEELAEAVAATCQLKLTDINNKYSPAKASSPLYGDTLREDELKLRPFTIVTNLICSMALFPKLSPILTGANNLFISIVLMVWMFWPMPKLLHPYMKTKKRVI